MDLDKEFPENTYRGRFHKQLMALLNCLDIEVNLFWAKQGSCHMSFSQSWDKICTISYNDNKVLYHYFGFNDKAYCDAISPDSPLPDHLRKHITQLAHHISKNGSSPSV